MASERARWGFPEDLTGKTVLDIGCADGGWSVEAMRRGAKHVVSIDEQVTNGMSFLLEHKVFPFDYRRIDLFSEDFIKLPQFDFIIFAGVLYHVHDVLEALKRVRAKTRELVLMETHINESLGVQLPYMIYYENGELGGDNTNWWGPNLQCLQAMLRTVGFAYEQTFIEYGNQNDARIGFLMRPISGSVYSKVIESATGTNSMIEQYTQTIRNLYLGNTELKEESARLQVALQQAETSAIEKQRYFDAVTASISWRLTAPLRAIAQMFRRNT